MKGTYTFNDLKELCENRGLEYGGEIRTHTKREKIKVYCECSGEREVLVSGLKYSNYCCRRRAKLGENNPAHQKHPGTKVKSVLELVGDLKE